MKAAPALALACVAALGGCAGDAFRATAATEPVFRPDGFFAGATTGTGTLKVIGRERVETYVEGTGRMRPDGVFQLRQRVTEGSKPARTRTWRLKPAGGGRWTGTMTDAKGPVDAFVRGNLFHVAYDGDGVGIEQWLYLQPDGRTVENTLVARKMGATVARLEETIRKR